MGEDAIEALLSEFPATEIDQPATQAFVHAETASLRADIASLRTDIFDRLRQQTVWMSSLVVASIGRRRDHQPRRLNGPGRPTTVP